MTPLQADSLAPDTCASTPPSTWRQTYLRVLTWAFMLLTGARLAAYAPTVLAILQTRDSHQHSLWTWLIWVGANATMAAWLYEQNGHRIDKAIGVSLANAAACLLTSGVIVWFRF
ncbi:hypothetical protein [Comamonas serinivorans]|uniref:hypothetical protein n=1 Tax=Comamonas serinivorans TaxID=1082851 RepID=UPI0012F7EACD|nr:hypothetical protein [Comamonas serinivorans]